MGMRSNWPIAPWHTTGLIDQSFNKVCTGNYKSMLRLQRFSAQIFNSYRNNLIINAVSLEISRQVHGTADLRLSTTTVGKH